MLILADTIEFFRVVPQGKLEAEVCQIFCYLFCITKVSHYGGRRGFRGGSDEKMRRMWLGREIVVAGLPPSLDPLDALQSTRNVVFIEMDTRNLHMTLLIIGAGRNDKVAGERMERFSLVRFGLSIAIKTTFLVHWNLRYLTSLYNLGSNPPLNIETVK